MALVEVIHQPPEDEFEIVMNDTPEQEFYADAEMILRTPHMEYFLTDDGCTYKLRRLDPGEWDVTPIELEHRLLYEAWVARTGEGTIDVLAWKSGGELEKRDTLTINSRKPYVPMTVKYDDGLTHVFGMVCWIPEI